MFGFPSRRVSGAQTEATYASLLSSLAPVLRSLPGQRILVTDPAPSVVTSGVQTGSAARRGSRLQPGAEIARLTTAAEFPTQPAEVSALRQGLQAVASADASLVPFVRFATDPATNSRDAVAAAAVLLTSRAAAMFEFGDEIGLDTYAGSGQSAGGDAVDANEPPAGAH